ncbi:hypothetical protein SLEP1_g54561 [Rubroshorea leprosula]|uniref:COP1-interacting protein 7 n=1 Tax=Rubroshorea leprosula TaxID=152421 RepID=A0AAV5MFS1_9ROSI|nr:hypothetical protein SLEP1_g54561 [Rubroshorea leprosula]
MKPGMPLDYAVFQLSPKRSRCELFVSSNGNIEKLAGGLVKPFVTHLKVAEEQIALAAQSIKLEVEKHKNTWFTKGTLERFVRFVSTPEVLESVNTFDAEMSQLEGARRMYSQGVGGQHSGEIGAGGTGLMATADATKRKLLRAIDVRLAAVQQDLTAACARASAAGFNPYTVSELQQFADQFGAHRLNEACMKFISLCQRRPDLISTWKPGASDQVVRASWESDMSIDDPAEDLRGSHNSNRTNQPLENKHQEHPAPSTMHTQRDNDQLIIPATFQQSKSSNTTQQHVHNQNHEEKAEGNVTEPSPIQMSQPTRRLSVQDRINLFENKQKENSNSGGKPIVVGKSAELRRLSSDVSSAPGAVEKGVLRRWSVASDMSIDLGNDKKDDSTDRDSPLCTPTSSSLSQAKSNDFLGLSEDKVSLVKVEPKNGSNRAGNSGLNDQGGQAQVGSLVGDDEDVGLKGQVNWKDNLGSQNNQFRSFLGKVEQVGAGDRGVSLENKKGSLAGGERSGLFNDIENSNMQLNKNASRVQIGDFRGRLGDAKAQDEFKDRVEAAESEDHPMAQARFRGSQHHNCSFSGQLEGGFGLKTREAHHKGTEADQLVPQPQWKSFTGGVEEAGKKELASLKKQPSKVEDAGVQRMKVQKQVSIGSEQTKKSQDRGNDGSSIYGNGKPLLPSKKGPESEESFGTPTVSEEQVQRVRQSRGNQELNNELKMKANELEKLFAEHKLRAPSDQFGSTRRGKPAEVQIDQEASPPYRKQPALDTSSAQLSDKNTTEMTETLAKFSTPPTKIVDNEEYGDTLGKNFSQIRFSDDSRGKFYEKYMQKRDAKLREEWGSKRAEKEAKLKAMQDTLERSRAEIKAKFSGSSERKDSVSSARQRVEKLRSFNFQSQREQHPVSSIQSEEDEDPSEFQDQKCYGQMKKPLPNKTMPSSTPCTTTASVPRLSGKVSSTSSGRRVQSDNPIAQSVPNFSDLRKENTKPSSATTKMTNRSQVRNHTRSKSSNEETTIVKEEKSRRSHSLRKSSAGQVEFMDSDGVVLAPLKSDKGQTDETFSDKFLKNVDTKTFLRKGNGSIKQLKASVTTEIQKDGEEFDELAFDADDSTEMAKEDDEEELETTAMEDCTDMDNGRSRRSQESDKLDNSESENGDSLRSLSQVDPASVAEVPSAVSSTFQTAVSRQDSPGESPISWNMRMHHPFSYSHETSDIDASLDSPIGSPASWNSHFLNQTEADATRMRKKWGSAQKPFLISNATHNQSRKDVTKGFKRLLKFGRKSRGTDSLMDWISATTSEGDDDTEDGRDSANRSSEDLRKSRMGFLQGHPSDDSFNESELNEQGNLFYYLLVI